MKKRQLSGELRYLYLLLGHLYPLSDGVLKILAEILIMRPSSLVPKGEEQTLTSKNCVLVSLGFSVGLSEGWTKCSFVFVLSNTELLWGKKSSQVKSIICKQEK